MACRRHRGHSAVARWEPRGEPARSVADSAPASGGKEAQTTTFAAVSAESASPSLPTQVPSRLFPDAASSVRDAPRPPLGVGPAVFSSSM